MTSSDLKAWAKVGVTGEIASIESGILSSRPYANTNGITIEQIEGLIERRRILLAKLAEIDGVWVCGSWLEERDGRQYNCFALYRADGTLAGAYRKVHHMQAGVGHYGVFSGRRWNNEIYPLLRDFVHVNS